MFEWRLLFVKWLIFLQGSPSVWSMVNNGSMMLQMVKFFRVFLCYDYHYWAFTSLLFYLSVCSVLAMVFHFHMPVPAITKNSTFDSRTSCCFPQCLDWIQHDLIVHIGSWDLKWHPPDLQSHSLHLFCQDLQVGHFW